MHKCKCGKKMIPATRLVCEACEENIIDWFDRFFANQSVDKVYKNQYTNIAVLRTDR